ncbi:MAG: hypothetical protein K9L02_04820 [Acholeplasmataceae bacterium]|nr:hypothetical protein [Acholeplasmataceae bacterium]
MKKFNTIGILLFDYMISVVLLNLAILLVIPFIPLWIGYQKYIETDLHSRSLKLIFTNIKDNVKIISQITIFLIVLFGFAYFNLMWLKTDLKVIDIFIKIMSYIVLWIGLTILIYAPTIITNMNVTFKQLLYNGIMLIFGGITNYLISLALIVVFLYLSIQSIIVLILGIPFVIYMISKLSIINLNYLKEKMK